MKKEDYLVQEIARLNLLVAEFAVALFEANKKFTELQSSQQEVTENVQTKK